MGLPQSVCGSRPGHGLSSVGAPDPEACLCGGCSFTPGAVFAHAHPGAAYSLLLTLWTRLIVYANC